MVRFLGLGLTALGIVALVQVYLIVAHEMWVNCWWSSAARGETSCSTVDLHGAPFFAFFMGTVFLVSGFGFIYAALKAFSYRPETNVKPEERHRGIR